MTPLLAAGAWGWTLGEVLIAVVILGACVGITYVALRQFGIVIPAWVIQIFWIVVVAVVAVVAIKFVLSL